MLKFGQRKTNWMGGGGGGDKQDEFFSERENFCQSVLHTNGHCWRLFGSTVGSCYQSTVNIHTEFLDRHDQKWDGYICRDGTVL